MRLRKMLFWAHLAAGCAAGLVILIMAVTGVLLTYQRQVIRWADRDYRSTAVTRAQTAGIDAILAGVKPVNAVSPTAITLHSDVSLPAEVSVGRDLVFLVDAASGRILGESSPRVRLFFQQVENIHRWLGQSAERRTTGRAITGAANLAFFGLVLSGPLLWIPRKWSSQSVKAVTLFRPGLTGRARDFNWHNVIGIWCALPLLVIVTSGVVMSYPWANNLVYKLTGSPIPVQNAAPGGEVNRTRHHDNVVEQYPSSLDALWQKAQQQVPGWQTITLRIPPNMRGQLTFTIDTGNGGRPDQRAQLTLDSRTGQVIRWEPFSSNNAGRRLRSWLRFLHTGEAGGVVGQTLAGLASLGAAILVWTGLRLAVRRLQRLIERNKKNAESTSKTLQEAGL